MTKDANIVVKRLILGPFIKKRREELGFTQADLSRSLGYTYPNFIGMLENGVSKFPFEKWTQFADVLEVPRHIFLEMFYKEAYPEVLDYISFHPAEKAKTQGQALKKKTA